MVGTVVMWKGMPAMSLEKRMEANMSQILDSIKE